jgi:beta-lactamase regulating signal transducer with metallopeptidase domain
MTWLDFGMMEGPLLMLGKGVLWLGACGMIRRMLPKIGTSWRVGLVTLLLISAAGVFPTLWTWTVPLPEPTETSFQPPAASGSPASLDSTLVPVAPSTVAKPAPDAGSPWPWQAWLAILWLGGSAGLLLWLITGYLMVQRWIRAAVPLTDCCWQDTLAEEGQRQSLRRMPELLVSPEVPGPCVAGGWRPVLLLPVGCQEWDAETRRIVICHELAHLRHGDPEHRWVRSAALVIHWLNPLVWFAVSRSRQAEEWAADRAVLARGIEPGTYAATLLRIARSCQFTTQTPLVTAMAHSSNLESRIRLLLDQKPAPQSPLRYGAAGIAIAFITAGFIGCSAVQRPSSQADENSLPGARTPLTSIDAGELKTLIDASPSKAKKFTVKCRVIDLAGRSLTVPMPDTYSTDARAFDSSLVLRPGQKGKVEIIREFPYPTRFDLADLRQLQMPPSAASQGGSFPVIPTIPLEFKFRLIGWVAEQVSVEPEGAFLMVSGTFQETTFDGFIRNTGEAYSPIISKGKNSLGMAEDVVLSDNKVLSPTFTQRETSFRVAALPGKTYRLRLNLKQPDAFLEVSCSPEE